MKIQITFPWTKICHPQAFLHLVVQWGRKLWIMKTFPKDLKNFQTIQMKWVFILLWMETGEEVHLTEEDLVVDPHKGMDIRDQILTVVGLGVFLQWDQEDQWALWLPGVFHQ